jgi:hypothetical protein
MSADFITLYERCIVGGFRSPVSTNHSGGFQELKLSSAVSQRSPQPLMDQSAWAVAIAASRDASYQLNRQHHHHFHVLE